MLSPTLDAPVMLPAYLDCWVQTNPSPAADPDVAIFLHGPQREMAEVQVCWRGDLPEGGDEEAWVDILSLCPPTTLECLPVPLHVFRDWMSSKGVFEDLSSDVVEILGLADKGRKEESRGIAAFVWRGPDESSFMKGTSDIHPGDTIVLRAQCGGWQALGHLPGAPADPQSSPEKVLNYADVRLLDVAEKSTVAARRRAVLRIHPELWPVAEAETAAAELVKMSRNIYGDWTPLEVRALLVRLSNDNTAGWQLDDSIRSVIVHLAKRQPSELLVDPNV